MSSILISSLFFCFVFTEDSSLNSHGYCMPILLPSKYTVCCSRAKTVNENLKMSAALLSRFDLVFILLGKPDESLDKRVSDHIIAVSGCQTCLPIHISQSIVTFSCNALNL